jgi:hypothetical protein
MAIFIVIFLWLWYYSLPHEWSPHYQTGQNARKVRLTIKMADGVSVRYVRPELNKHKQEIYDPQKCLKCLELGINLQDALSELSSLQLINKLLSKELKEATAKLEVMSSVSVKMNSGNVKFDEPQNRWMTAECKRHRTKQNVYIHHIFL